MLENVNEMGVFGSVLLVLAVSTVWYSLPFFKTVQGNNAQLSSVKELALMMLGYAFLVWLLALLQLNAIRFGLSLLAVGSLLTVFMCTLFFLLTAAEGRGLRYYLMHCGFTAIFIGGTLAVLHYWPW